MGKYQYQHSADWVRLPAGWSLSTVSGLAIDAQDRLFLLCRSAHPVIVLGRDGQVLAAWGDGAFGRPHSICVGPDSSVYCTDDAEQTLSKFTFDGRLLLKLGGKDGSPAIGRITGVSLSISGEIYVGDEANSRVLKFSPDGRLLFSWGEPGDGPGQFNDPHFIWEDVEGRVWIVDCGNNRIHHFDSDGRFLGEWKKNLARPTAMFIDRFGAVYVAEGKQRISIFANDGTLLSRWGSEGEDKKTALFHTPHAIVVDSAGHVYVGENRHEMSSMDSATRALQKFARQI